MFQKLSKAVYIFLTLLIFSASLAHAAPVPSVSIGHPDKPFIGQNFDLELAFDNTDATDTGFGPFIDAYIPATGADGDDGIIIADGTQATYLGVAVTTVIQTFPNDGAGVGCVEHPYAVDNSGAKLEVCGPTGDKLVTILLPFGSFVPDQPAATVKLPVKVSELADLGHDLTICARSGFQFGADALDNPSTDPSILSDDDENVSNWTPCSTVEPSLIKITKKYNGPEDETATGPNFPREYRLEVEVAPGQTVTNLDVIDALPNNMAFKRVVSTSPGGATQVSTPDADLPANSPDNILDVRFDSITGDGDTNASPDAVVVFEYFIPRTDADGTAVIDAASGDDALSENQARAQGDWNPTDNRDAGGTDNAVADPSGVEHTLTDKSIAIQKGVSNISHPGAEHPVPGDVLEYTITFQVSDYFSFNDVNITDILSDGQRFDTNFTPTLNVTVHGSTSNGDMDGSNVVVTSHYSDPPDGNAGDGTDGTTEILFKVSDELNSRGADSRLTGGCIPTGGTGAGNAPDCSTFDQGATTGTIVFRAVVQQNFSDNHPSGDASVDQGDVLNNTVAVTGSLLSVEDNNTPTGQDEQDGSQAQVSIGFGELSKEIYAVNGNVNFTTPVEVRPGDTITYRIKYTLPTSDVEDLSFIDYLPKPVLEATEVTAFDDVANSDVPAAGHAKFGPDDTFHAIYDDGSGNDYPALSTSSQENTITFAYGDFDSTDQTARTIDLLFTVTVTDDPFADELYLTNQVRSTQGSTNAADQQADAIIQISLREPDLKITKGVSDSTNSVAKSTISPPATTLPVDGDMASSDGNDTVTFTITVENVGGSEAHEVTITDDTSDYMDNCQVTGVKDGSGTDLSYSGDLFGAGLVLDNTLAANDENPSGGGAPFSTDTAIITFTCDIKTDVNPQAVIDSSASVTWKADSGAANAFAPRSDNARVTMADPSMTKSIVSVTPGPIATNVTAGDTIRYRIEVTLPEGEIPDLQITDTLPAGFSYVANSLSVDDTGFAGSVDTDPTITVSGQAVTIQFDSPTATTVDSDNDETNNTFVITLEALVNNDPANDGLPSLQTKRNSVQLSFTNGTPVTTSVDTRFGEPSLTVVKTMSPSNPDAGDVVEITIQVTNNGTSPAHDITVSDTLDDDIFDLSTITEGTTPTGFTFSSNSTTGQVSYSESAADTSLNPGDSATFTFTVEIKDDVVTGSSYTNSASATFDSQNGDVEQERESSGTDDNSLNVASGNLAKSLSSSSEDWTNGTTLAVGEVATFQLILTLPEGRTQASDSVEFIEDALPLGYKYIDGTAQYRTVCDNSIENDLGALPTVDTAITPNVSGDGSGSPQTLSFDLGDYLQNNDSDDDDEQVIITYQAQVLNVAANNRGDSKTNTATFTYKNSAGTDQTTQDSVTTTVGEPSLGLTLNAAQPAGGPGCQVEYTARLTNATGSQVVRAWEPVITDTLDTDKFENFQVVSATLHQGTNSYDIADCASFGGADGNELTVNLSCRNQAERYLDPDDYIEVVYRACLKSSVNFGETITNDAQAAASSLPGDHGTYPVSGNPGDEDGERTGTGGVNDLTVSDSATVTVATPTITLTPDTSLPVGDTVERTVTVEVPVGTKDDFTITVDLPAGVSYTGQEIAIAGISGDLSVTNNPSTTPGAGTDPLVFNFGTIENSGSNSATFTITYEVVIENVLGNQRGSNLTDVATMTYAGQAGDPPTASATTIVLEPNLEIDQVIVSGAVGSDAGDTVRIQTTLRNIGDSTARQVVLRDILPAELLGAPDGSGSGDKFINVTLTNDSGDVVLSSDGTTLLTASHAVQTGDTLSWQLFDMPPGGSITITYDAVVSNGASSGATINTMADVAYHSIPNGGRDGSDLGDDDNDDRLNNYHEQDQNSLTLAANISIQKAFASGQADNRFSIGEDIPFDIRIDFVEGTTNNVVITDILPEGMEITEISSIEAGNMGISYSNTPDPDLPATGSVTIDLGDIVDQADNDSTNDFVIVHMKARLLDQAVNGNGSTRTNQASVASDQGNSGPVTLDVQVADPVLEITKTASDTTPSLGDEVTFVITVSHTGESLSTAYDVAVTDTLPDGLSYVEGSAAGPVTVVNPSASQPIFSLGSITLAEGSKQFSFRARVANDAIVGQPLTNTAEASYSSMPGSVNGERSFNTNVAEASVTPDAASFIDAVKTVTLATDDDSSGNITPGDTLEYTISIANNGPAVTGVYFTDSVPLHTTYVPATLNTTKGTSDDSNAPDLSVTIGDLAEGENVSITFRVRVDAGTAEDTLISNQGLVDSDQTVPEPTDSDGVDSNGDQPTVVTVASATPESGIYIWKFVQWTGDNDGSGTVTAGDTMRCQVQIYNTGEVPLTGVTYSGVIPDGLTYTGSSGTSSGTLNISGTDISLQEMEIAPGEYETLWFDITIDDWTGSDTRDFSCQGNGDSDQTDPVLSDGNGDPSDGTQPTLFEAVASGSNGSPHISVTKSWTIATDLNDDGLPGPGDTITCTTTVANNGSAIATNVWLNEPVPTSTNIVPGSITTSRGIVSASNPVQVNIGDLEPGQIAIVRFQVQIPQDADINDPIATTATVTADGGINETAGCETVVSAAHVFDPPSGYKTVNPAGWPELVWQQVWINDGNAEAMNVRIVDPMPEGTRYVEGSLTCEARGASSTTACYYDSANAQVVWEGSIAADPGGTTEQNSDNEVVIVFRTTVPSSMAGVENQAQAYWDENGDGTINDSDQNVQNNTPILTDDPYSYSTGDSTRAVRPEVVGVPTLNEWGMIIFGFLAGLVSLYRLKNQRP